MRWWEPVHARWRDALDADYPRLWGPDTDGWSVPHPEAMPDLPARHSTDPLLGLRWTLPEDGSVYVALTGGLRPEPFGRSYLQPETLQRASFPLLVLRSEVQDVCLVPEVFVPVLHLAAYPDEAPDGTGPAARRVDIRGLADLSLADLQGIAGALAIGPRSHAVKVLSSLGLLMPPNKRGQGWGDGGGGWDLTL